MAWQYEATGLSRPLGPAKPPRSGRSRRTLLLFFIVFTVALPRAGILMPWLEVPLPFQTLFIHLLFWPYLFVGRWPSGLSLRRVLFAFAAFAASGIIAALLGGYRGGDPSLIAIELATMLGQIPSFFLVVWFVRDGKDAAWVGRWLALSVLAASIYGIAQYYIGPSLVIPGITYTARTEVSLAYIIAQVAHRRAISSYGDPNIFAGMLVQFLPVLIGATLGARRRPVRWHFRILVGTAVLSGLSALFFCNSRAAFLGIAIDLAILALLFRWQMLKVLLVGAAVAAALYPRLETEGRFSQRLSIPEEDPRREYWECAKEIVAEHPEGSGFGMHVEAILSMNYTRLVPAGSVWTSYNSSYLHMLSKAGLLGLSTFALACLISARRVWRSRLRKTLPFSCWGAAVGCLTGCIGVQVTMLVNPYYQLPGGGSNFWLGMGLAYVLSRMAFVRGPLPVRATRGGAS